VEGRWLGLGPQSLGDQVGDVVGTEGLEAQEVFQKPADQVLAMEFGQGDDALEPAPWRQGDVP